MKKRILSLLLTLVMVISLIPTTAWAADTVKATVNFTAQAEGSFLIPPQFNVEVDSGLAESYGYTDGISKAANVSALDVLVKAHQIMLGEETFTKDDKNTYLAVGSDGFVTKLFGTATASSGFILNGAYPNDGTESSYGGYTSYNGTTVTTQKVVNNDTVEFFIYQDNASWSDNLSWFCDAEGNYISSLSATAGQSLTLMVKGIGYMSGASQYADANTLHAAEIATTVNNAKLAWVNANTGVLDKTAITATTDSTGKVTFTAPATAGTYYLTAYTEGTGATPLIMAVLPITVTDGTTGGGTETGSGTDTPDTPTTETLESLTLYTSQSGTGTHALTPAFNPDVREYSISVADNVSTANVFAAATPTTTGSKVKVSWTNLDTGETSTEEISATARTQLANCAKMGKTGNTVTLTVDEGTSAGTYTVTVKRSPTLKALSITDVPLKEAFRPANASYTAETTAESVTFNATGSYDGYNVTYNGDTSSTVSLAVGENTVKVEVTNPDGGLSKNYTVKITRKAQTGVTFNVPEGASLVVYDASGRVIAPTSGTTYPLAVGDKYTYTVTKAGCKSSKGTYTPTNEASQTVTVTLDSAGTAGIHNSVDAAWKNFRNSDVNMGITDKQTPVSADTAVLKWSKKIGEPGSASNNWKGTDPSAQIIVDNSLIVMSGTTLYKLSLDDGHVVAQATMVKAPSMGSYIPPTYADGLILCPLSDGTIQAFDAKTLASVWVYTDPAGGQAQSPITYSGGYAYTGFWNAETESANYVCLSLTDEDSTETNEDKYATWSKTVTGGFYWAGSVVVGNALIVGSDDGAPVGTNGTSYLYALDKTTGNEINKLALIGLGDQRSSIAYDSDTGRVYFTTKGGYLCSAKVDAATGALSELMNKRDEKAKQSTSTPIVYGDYVYYCFGTGVSKPEVDYAGYFAVAKADTLETVSKVGMLGYPQCSPLLSTAYEANQNALYFYCTYNKAPGGISLIKVDTTNHQATLTELFTPDESMQQYCIASIICDTDGTLYYKNDSCNVFAIKTDPDALSAAAAVTAKINAIGTVTLGSESKINAARSAYNALTPAQKALVSSDTLATLTAAETKLAELKKEAADQAAADAVKGKINAIGTVTLNSESKINAARSAYNALTPAQKALVSNDTLATLTAAEAKLDELKEQKAAADRAAADAVIAKINAVTSAIEGGDKDAIKSAINDAMAAYNALTAAQKALVTNYNVLAEADRTYNTSNGKNDPIRRQPSATGSGSGTTGGSTANTKDDVKSPTTGDSSHMLLWLSGTLLSAAAIAVLTMKKKRSAR